MKNLAKFSRIIAIGAVIGLAGCGTLGELFSKKTTSSDVIFWDSSVMTNVTKVTDDGLSKQWARISPDGSKLLYCESNRTISRSDSYYHQNWDIVLLRNPAVPSKTALVNGYALAPGWSDNNTNYFYIAYEDGNTRIIRSSASGGGKTYVTRTPIGSNDNRPDNREGIIICDTWMNGRRQLVSLRENGTEITFLGDGEQPSWHPKENKIVFIRNVSSSNELKAVYEMDLSSAQVTEIYRDPNNYNCRGPSYSADGRYILFQKGAEVRTTGSSKNNNETIVISRNKWQIFIMNADGSGLTTLTSGNVDAFSPSMDVNGWLYFIADTGKTEIFRSRVSLE